MLSWPYHVLLITADKLLTLLNEQLPLCSCIYNFLLLKFLLICCVCVCVCVCVYVFLLPCLALDLV